MIYAGTVIKVEESINGSPMYTVATPNGAVFFPCFLASTGGGFDAKYMLSPVEEGSEVVITDINKSSVYYILGGIAYSSDQVGTSTSGQSSLNMDADYTGHHHTETVIRNTNSTVNLSPTHDLTLRSPNMRMQLNGGKLRVSQQGASANYILNGQPFLNELFSYIATMEARINELSDVVNVLGNEILAEFDALVAKSTSGAITAEERVRLVQLALLGVANPLFRASVSVLNTPISDSNVAKSSCESTQNNSIKIP